MYTASSAVVTRIGSVARDCWYACRVPAKNPLMVDGNPILFCMSLIASVASLRERPGARLNDTVTEGKTPVWLTWMGVVLDLAVATALMGVQPITVADG